MKPLSNKDSCDPISSNCVIWQGPDIKCINLCKGDSVSEVVSKMATELCNLLEDLKIDSYEISCFNLGECTPDDFKGLIQLLIDRICALENIEPVAPTPGGVGCPDCVVTVCPAFYFENNVGDTETTMQLADYVLAIGNKVCTIVGQITTIQATLAQHEQRITTLENAPAPTFNLPTMVPVCVLPSIAQPINVVLQELENQFCLLRTATGDPTAISVALLAACSNLNTSPQLSGSGNMSDLAGWFPSPSNMSESFSNLWKTLCDARDAVKNIQDTCCTVNCSEIDLFFEAELLNYNTLQIDYKGFIPNNFIDLGSTVSVESATTPGTPFSTSSFNLKSLYYDSLSTHNINLITIGLTGEMVDDLIVTVNYSFIDPTSGLTCSNFVKRRIDGANACPKVSLISGYGDLRFSFNWVGYNIDTFVPLMNPITYPYANMSVRLSIWDQLGNTQLTGEETILSSQLVTDGNSVVNGIFAGLSQNTVYQFRLRFATPTGYLKACNPILFKTLNFDCVPVDLRTIIKDLENPQGSLDGLTIESYVLDYNAAH
jgi:hypothetical protein